MSTITIPVFRLQPGDYVVPAQATVKDIQRIGSLVIVDFTDSTSTAPIPGYVHVEIERKD